MDLFARMLNGETPIRSEVTHLYTMLLQGGAVGSHMHMPMAPASFTAEEPVTAPWELISRGKQVGAVSRLRPFRTCSTTERC